MTEVPPSAGDIYLANLDPVKGSKQAGTRPVFVISAQMMNVCSMRVIVCPITSNM